MTVTGVAPPLLSVTVLGDVGPWQAACASPGWQVRHGRADEAALLALVGQERDALLWAAPSVQALQGLKSSPALAAVAADTAVLVLVPAIADDQLLQLLQLGVEDVVVMPPVADGETAAQSAALARSVQVAVARKRRTVLQRRGGSIDVATGLPTQLQWLDHLNQLCALREREPASMAVVVLRLEGNDEIERQFGPEALALVQRKLAVRLRATLRASDVVGTVTPQAYAVLLAWMESAADADLVAAKLLRSLEEPVRVGIRDAAVGVSTGIAHHGVDGKDGASLLRVALTRAGASPEGERPWTGPPQSVRAVDQGRSEAANDADH